MHSRGGLDIRMCADVPVLCCARTPRSRAPAELECLCGGSRLWSCSGWSITCRCRSIVARHSRAAQQQQPQKWDGIAWHGPSPTTDRTELSACQVGLGFGQAGAGRGSRSLPQAPLPQPRPMLLTPMCLGPGVVCVIGCCAQYDLELAGTRNPDRCLERAGVRADSGGRPSNSTSGSFHVMTAIGCEAVVCVRTRKVVGALLPFPQAFSGA